MMPWSRDRDLNPRPHPYHGCARFLPLMAQEKVTTISLRLPNDRFVRYVNIIANCLFDVKTIS